jgi:SAM-dependent methyltransferase
MSAGVLPSPNIWGSPAGYEVENRGVDPAGVIEAAMAAVRPWDAAVVLDIGCGTGFHLPRFARRAATVIGVEPHPPLRNLARERVAALSRGSTGAPAASRIEAPGAGGTARIEVRGGTAQALPVPDASVDVVHARWAYFFGPGCEPGLHEISRVLRRGGAAFVIDNDATRSTFGSWFRRAHPDYDPEAVRRFWARQGWQRTELDIRWEHVTRADFETAVRLEFAPDLANQLLAEHPGTSVDYAVNLFWRTTG